VLFSSQLESISTEESKTAIYRSYIKNLMPSVEENLKNVFNNALNYFLQKLETRKALQR